MDINNREFTKHVIDLAGGPSAVAKTLGIKPQSVQGWVDRNHIPTNRVLTCSAMSEIPAYEIDPVQYPPELFAPTQTAAA